MPAGTETPYIYTQDGSFGIHLEDGNSFLVQTGSQAAVDVIQNLKDLAANDGQLSGAVSSLRTAVAAKVNSSDLANLLAGKADVAALDLKADIASVAVKADKTQVAAVQDELAALKLSFSKNITDGLGNHSQLLVGLQDRKCFLISMRSKRLLISI